MPTPIKNLVSTLLVSLAMSGCATTEPVPLHPVESSTPPMTADVFDPGQVTTQPVPLFQARPRYPFALRKAGVSGEGVVSFTVRTDGSVGDAVVVRATDAQFGDAAVEAILKWKFRPAKVNGTPVNCRMTVPIVFSLNEG
jgi:TonB family protein